MPTPPRAPRAPRGAPLPSYEAPVLQDPPWEPTSAEVRLAACERLLRRIDASLRVAEDLACVAPRAAEIIREVATRVDEARREVRRAEG